MQFFAKLPHASILGELFVEGSVRVAFPLGIFIIEAVAGQLLGRESVEI